MLTTGFSTPPDSHPSFSSFKAYSGVLTTDLSGGDLEGQRQTIVGTLAREPASHASRSTTKTTKAGVVYEWAAASARLHPDCPPGDVPPRRWRRFLDDTRQFLNGPFCAAAVALGWGAHDLFGCDHDRPFARIDQAGLLWLLAGDRLVALSENTATIVTRTGARQTWRRKPSEPGRVLAWELPAARSL